MTDATPIRSFVAVPLPVTVQAEIAEAAVALARDLPGGIKWSKKAVNFHVTMKFLGPVAPERLDALGAALDGALADVPRFALVVRGFDAFPSARDAKIVFAGVDGDTRSLAEVAEFVEAVSAGFGFAREERRFTGHVTVGRSNAGVDARAALTAWTGRAFGTVEVDEVHVYESRLAQRRGDASTYVLRHRALLKAAAAPGARAN